MGIQDTINQGIATIAIAGHLQESSEQKKLALIDQGINQIDELNAHAAEKSALENDYVANFEKDLAASKEAYQDADIEEGRLAQLEDDIYGSGNNEHIAEYEAAMLDAQKKTEAMKWQLDAKNAMYEDLKQSETYRQHMQDVETLNNKAKLKQQKLDILKTQMKRAGVETGSYLKIGDK